MAANGNRIFVPGDWSRGQRLRQNRMRLSCRLIRRLWTATYLVNEEARCTQHFDPPKIQPNTVDWLWVQFRCNRRDTSRERTKRNKKNREWRRDSTRERERERERERVARYSRRRARAVLIKWLRFCAARVFKASAPIQAGLKERVHLADGDRRTYVSAGNDYHVENETRRDETRNVNRRWPTEEQASSSAGLNADIVESCVRWSYWTRRLSVFHSAGNFASNASRRYSNVP